jgi:modulator of FtsH protease
MSGLNLRETGNSLHGGETYYVMATETLYVAIHNSFISLPHLLGAAGSQD